MIKKFNNYLKISHDLFELISLGCLLLWLYWGILTKLVQDWIDDPNYSHGFLVPAISLYFVWERRRFFTITEAKPNRWGFWIILFGLSMLFAGHIGAELFLMRVSLPVVLMGLVIYLGGSGYGKVLRFPIVFLVLMIPLPAIFLNMFSLPLQRFAAHTATICLQGLSLPVFRDGNIIVLPRLTLEVAEACSGLRSLVSLLALGVVFAYFSQSDLSKRIILVVSTIPIAIIANAARVAGTGILAHYAWENAAQGFYHTFSGWLVFLVAFFALAVEGILISRWRWFNRKMKGL